MSQNTLKTKQVANQQDALTAYLEDLLYETDTVEESAHASDISTANIEEDTLEDTAPIVSTEKATTAKATTTSSSPNTAVDTTEEQHIPLTSEPPVLVPVRQSEPSDSAHDEQAALPKPPVKYPRTKDASSPLPLPPVLLPQFLLPASVPDIKSTVDDSGESLESSKEAPVEKAALAEKDTLTEDEVSQSSIVVPSWAQSGFQCLTFSVAGFSMAAPLEKLNGIIEWPEHLTFLPGHADWLLGLHRNRSQNVQVIDLALLLAGEHGLASSPELPAQQRAHYIMLVDEGRIGFASDTVANMLTLETDAVKWRATSLQQPIILGTVIDKMCSIIDVDALVDRIINPTVLETG